MKRSIKSSLCVAVLLLLVVVITMRTRSREVVETEQEKRHQRGGSLLYNNCDSWKNNIEDKGAHMLPDGTKANDRLGPEQEKKENAQIKSTSKENNNNPNKIVLKCLPRYSPGVPCDDNGLILMLGGNYKSVTEKEAERLKEQVLALSIETIKEFLEVDGLINGLENKLKLRSAIHWLKELGGEDEIEQLIDLLYRPEASETFIWRAVDILTTLSYSFPQYSEQISDAIAYHYKLDDDIYFLECLVRLGDEQGYRLLKHRLENEPDAFLNEPERNEIRALLLKYEIPYMKPMEREKTLRKLVVCYKEESLLKEYGMRDCQTSDYRWLRRSLSEWALERLVEEFPTDSTVSYLRSLLEEVRRTQRDYKKPRNFYGGMWVPQGTELEKKLLEGKNVEDKRREYKILYAIYRAGGYITEEEREKLRLLNLIPE